MQNCIIEELDTKKVEEEEEHKQNEFREFLENEIDDWGRQRITESQQEDKATRSNVRRAESRSLGNKREQEDKTRKM